MNAFKSIVHFMIGLIFATVVYSSDQSLFPDNHLFDTGEFTKALPIITCDAENFQFSKVLEGKVITHTFVIKNTGDTILKILNVKTGCGCSSASYDDEIQPGQAGNLTLKIDTNGYGGKQYKDEIHIISNDPNTPDFILSASGPVDELATLTPKGVSFKGKCTASLEAVVTIKPNRSYPFEITGFDLGKLKDKVVCHLVKQESAYLLSVRNLMQTPGRYWGKIVLNTDCQNSKPIDLWVSANLK
jgi:hypothetical protein